MQKTAQELTILIPDKLQAIEFYSNPIESNMTVF